MAPAEAVARSGLRKMAVWLRFHVASLVATGVDFGTMIAVVQLLRGSPVVGTVAGASLGAITNFSLGRKWTYRRDDAPLAGQAFRYALVSGGSLLLNAAGEYLLAVRLGLGYLLARVVVAVAVSNLWNFPLQSLVVFKKKRLPPQNPPS
jgi:putative flippase GtrA